MRPNRSIPDATIIPELAYADLDRAVRWLTEVFGFRERLRIADHRSQLVFDGGAIVAMDSHRERASQSPSGHGLLVRVNDVDAHFARTNAAGVEIVHPPTTYPYGERQYSVRDIGGHRWTFSQTVEDVDPAAWGGILR